jgi:hypothetical protein
VSVSEELDLALRLDQPLRLHLGDGEVVVARVLEWDGARVRCAVLRSSRPENHAHCDSTGHPIDLVDIRSVVRLSEPQARRSGRPRRSRA